MESENLPVLVPLGCALISVAGFVLHHRLSSGKVSEKYKDRLFTRGLVDGGQSAGLGFKYIAAAFGFWALGGFLSYAPLGSALPAVVMGLFIAGAASIAPLLYWRISGYPERMKPDWYKERAARYSARSWLMADLADTSDAAEVDAMVLAGAEGWKPLGAAPSQDASDRPPADYADTGTACLELDGHRLIPLILEIGAEPADSLWAWAGTTPSEVNDWLAFILPGDTSARVVLDDRELADGEPLPARYVQIETRGSWRLSLRTVDDLPTFEAEAGGRGLDVLHYVGPPGIAVFHQDGGSTFSLKLRDSTLARRPGANQILCKAAGEKGRVALSSGSVLEIGSGGAPWHVQVSPMPPSEGTPAGGWPAFEGPGLDEIRTFDTAVTGDRAEVLLYTGESGRLRVEYDGDGPFGIDRLSSSLAIAGELLSTPGDDEGEIDIRRHSLIQIRGGAGPWSLQRIT